MEYKPAEIIKQARGKAESALTEAVSDKISRICSAFTYDTGLNVVSVEVDFIPANTMSGKRGNIIARIRLRHEDA